MEETPEIIDAEYEVIFDPRPVQKAMWSFWLDDAPNLIGGLCVLGAYVLVRYWL